MPTIRIRASQEVRYDQTIEIEEDDLKELLSTTGRNMENEAMSPLNDWLDIRDVLEGRNFDDIEIDEVGGSKRAWTSGY